MSTTQVSHSKPRYPASSDPEVNCSQKFAAVEVALQELMKETFKDIAM